MKIALITDQHLGVRNDSQVFMDHFDRFYSMTFFPYLEKNKIDTVIMLGDLFDRRKYTNHNTLYRSRSIYFEKLRKYNAHLIIGNHDVFYKNTNSVNAPELFLKDYPNIKIYTTPSAVNFDGLDIAFLPWVCPENYDQSLKFIEDVRAPVLFGHLELQGFEMHRGTFVEHGMDISLFDRFDVVCSGHFHHKSSRGNIHYLGAPYEMTWMDYNDPRGFHVFDTETRALIYIQNPYRMFNKIHYDDSNKALDEILAVDIDSYRNTYVKIIVHQKNNPYWLDLLVEKLEKSGVIDLQTVEDHLNLNLEDEAEIIEDAEDTLTILKKVVDSLEGNTDKKQLNTFLANLYQEALYVE